VFSATNELFARLLLSNDANMQRLLQGWSKKKIIQ